MNFAGVDFSVHFTVMYPAQTSASTAAIWYAGIPVNDTTGSSNKATSGIHPRR
jgi:hypothetical protein